MNNADYIYDAQKQLEDSWNDEFFDLGVDARNELRESAKVSALIAIARGIEDLNAKKHNRKRYPSYE